MVAAEPALERLEPARGDAPDLTLADWAPRVQGMARALARSRADAEDLAQEVLARALAAPVKPPASALGPWLYRIARNAWIDRHRHEARGARGARAAPAEAATPDVSVPDDAPVLRAWRQLPEDERLVTWLRLMVDMPFREIAHLLDTSKSAVDRTFRRALARLRQELTP